MEPVETFSYNTTPHMKDATTLDTPPSSNFTEFNVRLEKASRILSACTTAWYAIWSVNWRGVASSPVFCSGLSRGLTHARSR